MCAVGLVAELAFSAGFQPFSPDFLYLWQHAALHSPDKKTARNGAVVENKLQLLFESLSGRHLLDHPQLDTCSNAARVRLDVHHTSPADFQLESRGEAQIVELDWTPADSLLKRSYLNADDAKRDGAYAIALAAVEQLENMVGVARCETRTGADYYVMPAGSDPENYLEDAYRLEVSGSDSGETDVRYRLKRKRQQALDGNSSLPAFAAVVGFRVKLILLEPAA
jgi:hypothetical protein